MCRGSPIHDRLPSLPPASANHLQDALTEPAATGQLRVQSVPGATTLLTGA